MTEKRRFIHTCFLFITPVFTAWMGLSVGAAIMLVGLLLLWRWLIVISGFAAPEKSPELALQTTPGSHFVEKVRWSMDRLGVDYTEHPSGGTLGALYCGRTVPQLKIRTGAVRSVIGNSPEILRYIWGRYGTEDPAAAAFLEPTAERIKLESRLDRHGVNLQVWVYYRLLDDRELTLHAWGVDNTRIPLWQRQLLRILFPVQAAFVRRSFAITDENVARSVRYIEAFLADMNSQLLDGRKSLLGDNTPNYTDYAFAAMVGLWLMPPGYGGGQAESVRIERDALPAAMRTDVESWEAAFPRVVAFVQSLYGEERLR